MKIGFVFPGQGSQYQGMGIDFYENYDVAKEIFNQASDITKLDLYNICKQGTEDDLKNTLITQPATVCVSIAILETIKNQFEKIPSPASTAGHSVGEISALICAEVIDFKTGMEIISKRAQYMQEAADLYPNCSMAAIIGLDKQKVIEICKNLSNEGIIQAANFNSPIQTIISGEGNLIEKAIQIATDSGAKKAIKLPVSGAWHSKIMEPAYEKLKDVIRTKDFFAPKIGFIPNLTGTYENNPENLKEYLIKQVISPVLWTDTIERMIENNIDTFIEIGPGKVLTGLIKRINSEVNTISISTVNDLQKLNTL